MLKFKVLYMMSWAVTDSVGTQLWIDRTCRVNLNYSGWQSFFSFNDTKILSQNEPCEVSKLKSGLNILSLHPTEDEI